MAPFYTKQGDTGNTGYLGDGRISKASLRIEAVGAVDEASAALGLARALARCEKTQAIILQSQKHLYWLMSEISASADIADKFDMISDEHVRWLETMMNDLEKTLDIPSDFILPGENISSGALGLARTIVRRAERRVAALYESGEIKKPELLAYLNRLSSLIFVLEIYESSLSGSGLTLAKEE